jgi:hypothetical protein
MFDDWKVQLFRIYKSEREEAWFKMKEGLKFGILWRFHNFRADR